MGYMTCQHEDPGCAHHTLTGDVDVCEACGLDAVSHLPDVRVECADWPCPVCGEYGLHKSNCTTWGRV